MIRIRIRKILRPRLRMARRSGRKTGPCRGQKGMTMIEMMIVMSLIVGLSVVILGAVMDGQRQAQLSQTEMGFGTIESSLTMYKLHMKRYPTSDQGLNALVSNPGGSRGWRGPYLKAGVLEDAWGIAVRYESDGRKYNFTSAGPDQEFDTDDDLKYPEEEIVAAGNAH